MPTFSNSGFSADEVRGVRDNPDKYEEIHGSHMVVRLYAAQAHLATLVPHWVVVGEAGRAIHASAGLGVMFALRMADDLAPDLGTRSPLAMLRALTDRFGLSIEHGDRHDRIQVLTKSGTHDRFSPPAGFADHQLTRFGQPDVLLFVLDMTLYREYIQKLKL